VTLFLGLRRSFRNGAGQFDFKRLDDDAHVLVGMFFLKMFSHLCGHVVFPNLKNLSLVVRERLQHFSHIVAAVQNVFHFPGLQRQTFDNRKFQACLRATVTNGCDFRQINGMLPLRAVVDLDDVA
jgi:hypothetical protein